MPVTACSLRNTSLSRGTDARRSANDAACTSASITRLFSTGVGNIFGVSSVALGSDGLGLISFSGHSGDLNVAHCDDQACSSATITALAGLNYGSESSVVIDASGLALISHDSLPNSDLKVTRCTSIDCTSAQTTTVDSVGDVGEHPSITVGPDGRGLVSYYDATNDVLKVAHLPHGL